MSYVVYHKDTTRFLRNHPGVKTDLTRFGTLGQAKAALTREIKNTALKVQPILRENFLICTSEEFTKIEKTETVTMHGNGTKPTAPYEIGVNTPIGCDPRSETYWCM